MPRSSRQEPWAEVAAEFGQRIGSLLKDVVPPDAQRHLLNAQRELITALFLIYEHQAGGRRAAPRRRVASGRSRRVERIDID
jgi:hypothetical protein